MGKRGYQDDPLAVGESRSGKSAYGPIEKILILVELDDVIARRSVCHDLPPGFSLPRFAKFAV